MADPYDALKTPPVVHDLAGTTVGRFRIGARLGEGGMGLVYRAEDSTLKRVVAIKRLAPQYQFDEHDRDRFLKEAQRASALNHPNIAAIYDVLVERGEILLVMEYVEGMTLRHRLRKPVSIEEFLEIAEQCVDGLEAAHAKRIVHGDIKPENIMLTAAGRIKILDFGVAKRFGIAEATDATESLASMKGSFSGTPAYMAPEVLTQKPYDGRADIFSLGLVFYELLGHKQPFRTESFAGTLGQLLHSDPPPVSNLNPDVPPALAALIGKMMMKDAKLRSPNLQAVATDLRLIARNEITETVHRAVLPEKKPRWQSRVIVWGFLLALLAALALGYWPLRHYSAKKAAVAALPEKQVLAVLPFPAVSGDARLTALGQGLVESVAAKLGRFSEDRPLEVIPARNMQEKSATSLEDARKQFGSTLGLGITLEQSGNFMRVVAPVSHVNSQLFTDMATTFAAISRDPQALEATIQKSPPSEQEGIRSFPVQRPFLRDLADFSTDLKGATHELRGALPIINPALEEGTPVLRRTVALNERTRVAFVALRDLVRAPTTNAALVGLAETVGVLNPLVRFLGPYQTVCDYWNYFWTFLGEHLSEGDPTGTAQRANINDAAHQSNSLRDIGATEPANGHQTPLDALQSGESAPGYLHGQPYWAAVDNSGAADCENGQRGYPMGRLARLLKPTDSTGAPFLVVGDSHTPGNQGPTFAGLSRVPPGETFSREPQNGAQLP